MKTDAERALATIDALVEEAYAIAIEKGMAITNPDGWRAWKRSVYVETAKREGAGYLRKQHTRLGLGSTQPNRVACAKCGTHVIGNPILRDGENDPYCSFECAGLKRVTMSEWLATVATEEQRIQMMRLIRRREASA